MGVAVGLAVGVGVGAAVGVGVGAAVGVGVGVAVGVAVGDAVGVAAGVAVGVGLAEELPQPAITTSASASTSPTRGRTPGRGIVEDLATERGADANAVSGGVATSSARAGGTAFAWSDAPHEGHDLLRV